MKIDRKLFVACTASAFLLSGCATVESVERAQAVADQALALAQQDQTAAQQAQATADSATAAAQRAQTTANGAQAAAAAADAKAVAAAAAAEKADKTFWDHHATHHPHRR